MGKTETEVQALDQTEYKSNLNTTFADIFGSNRFPIFLEVIIFYSIISCC